jgi:sigma-B regulation protein RsbU (phosphoserine phosphatase)
LRAVAVYDDDPVRVLNNLNAVLRQELQGSRIRLCTLIFGKVTLCGNGFDVELASGGHPPPLPLCADGSVDYVDTTGGQAAGITAEPHFVANRFRLYPGDTLVLYTDGLTEASTGVGLARYDDEGALLRFAKSHSPTTALDIVDAVRRVLDGFGSGLEDDTAVLALGVPGVPTPTRGYPVCTHYRYRSCTWRSPILPRRCHRTSTSAFRCSTVSPPT